MEIIITGIVFLVQGSVAQWRLFIMPLEQGTSRLVSLPGKTGCQV